MIGRQITLIAAHVNWKTKKMRPDERGRSSSDRLVKSDSLARKGFNFDDDDDSSDGDIESFLQNKKVERKKKKRRNQEEKSSIELTSPNQQDEAKQSNNSQNFDAQAEKHHRALIVGLLNGRAVWSGGDGIVNQIFDSYFFVCQYHPLLCIFLAHPAHPFQREERGVHLLAMLFFAFFIAALSELKHGDQSIFSTAKILWVLLSNFLLLALDTFMREVVTCSCVHPGGLPTVCCLNLKLVLFFLYVRVVVHFAFYPLY